MDLLECLMKVGFTRHESILYVTLCREGELTGYEASKISGIPRSNSYLALAGLVDKGGAFRIDSEPVKYTAAPFNELSANLLRQFNQALAVIAGGLPEKNEAKDPYITVSGVQNIRNKMKTIVENARERIYLSMAPSELSIVEEELKAAVKRGLKVVVITSPGYSLDGAVVYGEEKKLGQVRLIADTAHVLTGELFGEDPACLYSKNRNLVQLIRDSLQNEIRLIQLRTGVKR